MLFQKSIKVFFVSISISILLNGCTWYYNKFYTDPEKCMNEAKNGTPFDVVIVPGFPSENGQLNKTLRERVIWANIIYRNKLAKHIIFSGAATHTRFIESKLMRSYALQLGIPDSVITCETDAEHTTENIYYSYKIAQKNNWNKIAFATHPAQSSFMKPFRKKFNIKMDFLPIINDSVVNSNFKFELIDTNSVKETNFIALKDRESLIKRTLGTRGYKVKKMIKREKKRQSTQN